MGALTIKGRETVRLGGLGLAVAMQCVPARGTAMLGVRARGTATRYGRVREAATRGAVVTDAEMPCVKGRGRVQPLMTAMVLAVLDELVAVPAMPFAKD